MMYQLMTGFMPYNGQGPEDYKQRLLFLSWKWPINFRKEVA